MKIIFLGIGKTKHKFIIEGVERYKKLLSPYCSVEEKYIREEGEKTDLIYEESSRLLKNIPGNYHVVLLDIRGRSLSSEGFSSYLKNLRDSSVQGTAFIIGGSLGVDDNLRKRADLMLSFSSFTITHQLIRLLLAEQLYRAYSIINNRKYHK